jgi:hypothetical protein
MGEARKWVVVALACMAVIVTGGARANAADDPSRAPATTTSADGRSTTDGRRTLTVSKARGLNPAGETVTVDGSGYDTEKGIYVAFCVVPAPNQTPAPCGGGQDRSGSSGESIWISNNPPIYARGLTKKYGAGGTFRVQVHVQAALNDNVDCRKVTCAVVTRNDHTRSSDRSQDIFVPLQFGAVATPTTNPASTERHTTTTIPPAPLPTTTTTTISPALAAPLTTVSADRKTVSGDGKTLTASAVDRLTPAATVTVSGSGFDVTKGVYVSLCFINERNQPGPCRSGSAGAQAWVSSNPPDYGKGIATPYGDGGAFSVQLNLDNMIDQDHDCARVACAIATRNDDTHPDDHSQDLLLPVSFAPRSTPATVAVRSASRDTTNRAGLIAAGVIGLASFLGGAAMARRNRAAA